MKGTRFAAILFAVTMLAASCSKGPNAPRTEVPAVSTVPTLHLAPGDANALGVVHGSVVGVVPGGDDPNFAPVAGAQVDVYHMTLPPNPGPGDSVSSFADFKGTLYTNADGLFELRDVPLGEYSLHVIPPPATGYQDVSAYTFASDGNSGQGVRVELSYPLPPPPPPPPPEDSLKVSRVPRPGIRMPR